MCLALCLPCPSRFRQMYKVCENINKRHCTGWLFSLVLAWNHVSFQSAIFSTPKMAKNDPVLDILGVPKMALRVPESKFRNHFSIQTRPQNPQKDTSGTRIGPRKVIFGHFAFFWYFYLIFPLARALFFKSISTHQKLTPDKKEIFSQLLKHQNQRKNTSPLTNFHFCYFQPYLLNSDAFS